MGDMEIYYLMASKIYIFAIIIALHAFLIYN